MLRMNTDYYKVNFQLNEGGRFFTFSFMLFQPEYAAVAQNKGMIRLYLFGKVFLHWIKK